MTRPDAAQVSLFLASAERLAPGVAALAARIAEAPAPTNDEAERSALFERLCRERGLHTDVDALHDVVAVVPGERSGDDAPAVLVAAHLDTVFSRDTPISIRADGDFLHGPGIGDNSVGLASTLAVADLLRETGVVPAVDVLLTGNVGEEGLGNLRGIRAVIDANPRIAAVIAVEGHNLGRVTHIAVGSRRLRITAVGPGGHSWGDFGRPNAIHALARLIADLDAIVLPWAPKTTLSVGMIEGGISVNTIAPSATCLLDLRSIDAGALARLVQQVEEAIARAEGDGIRFDVEVLGDRPAGEAALSSPAVRAATGALAALGIEPSFDASSTDANVELSRGIAAVCIGLTHGGNVHRPDEYIDTRPLAAGITQLALLALELARMADAGVIAPRG
ncbi:MAG: M20/M25/M40 family metallo-hydrolase [Chloroflexota bacterium]